MPELHDGRDGEVIRPAGIEPDIDVVAGHVVLLCANRAGEEFSVIQNAENVFAGVFHSLNISSSRVTLHCLAADNTISHSSSRGGHYRYGGFQSINCSTVATEICIQR